MLKQGGERRHDPPYDPDRVSMRVVVTGGRHYRNWPVVKAALDAVMLEACGELELAQGGATGADALARRWCRENGIRPQTFAAAWRDLRTQPVVIRYDRHGKAYNAAAGAIRNEKMLRIFLPQLVIAFMGGPGTANCVALAHKMGIKVREIPDRLAA